jgi:hypothetical protein
MVPDTPTILPPRRTAGNGYLHNGVDRDEAIPRFFLEQSVAVSPLVPEVLSCTSTGHTRLDSDKVASPVPEGVAALPYQRCLINVAFSNVTTAVRLKLWG